MTTLGQFASRMDKLVDKLDGIGNDRAKRAAEIMLKELVIVTPVDTSTALSNWQIALGTRPSAAFGPYYPGYRGSTQAASASAALNVGMAMIAQKKPGEVLYLSNLIPYIVDLDRGTSSQEPGGFVERAAIKARNRTGAKVRRQ